MGNSKKSLKAYDKGYKAGLKQLQDNPYHPYMQEKLHGYWEDGYEVGAAQLQWDKIKEKV